jgi:hypothetical protein
MKPAVVLTGVNGNAFAILATCTRAGRKQGMDKELLEEFKKEAMSGNYDHLLQTCFKYFEVE